MVAMKRKAAPVSEGTNGAKRAKSSTNTPLSELLQVMSQHHDKVVSAPAGNVVHWFRSDLRLEDNRALHAASQKARENGGSLIALYIISPQDWRYHKISSIRVDFIARTLKILQQDLAQLNIPLHIETLEPRKLIPSRVVELMTQWNATELFANIEYEVDELDRDKNLIGEVATCGMKVTYLHDQCVVEPGAILSQAGKPMSVYTPWFRKWVDKIHDEESYLFPSPIPDTNPLSTREEFRSVFAEEIPPVPSSHLLSEADKNHFAALWPAGERVAKERLEKFSLEIIKEYARHRSTPALDSTSRISVHLSQGTVSARACVRQARSTNSSDKLDRGNAGNVGWIREVAWRDFYRHVLAAWPRVCKNKSYKREYDKIEWEDNPEQFQAWCEGRTGVPLVDAAMRHLKVMGWMPNRCRMIVASFLSKHLLIYWRLGERFFMQSLIDGDFASNNGGWQWSVGSGNDASPWFRIFNPWTQSIKFDPNGDYIRKYVKELEGLDATKIHDPYEKCSKEEFARLGYPQPIVDHKSARQRCLQRFKAAMTKTEE